MQSYYLKNFIEMMAVNIMHDTSQRILRFTKLNR